MVQGEFAPLPKTYCRYGAPTSITMSATEAEVDSIYVNETACHVDMAMLSVMRVMAHLILSRQEGRVVG